MAMSWPEMASLSWGLLVGVVVGGCRRGVVVLGVVVVGIVVVGPLDVGTVVVGDAAGTDLVDGDVVGRDVIGKDVVGKDVVGRRRRCGETAVMGGDVVDGEVPRLVGA